MDNGWMMNNLDVFFSFNFYCTVYYKIVWWMLKFWDSLNWHLAINLLRLSDVYLYVLLNWVIIGLGNGSSPDQLQAITWTNADLTINWNHRNTLQWNESKC